MMSLSGSILAQENLSLLRFLSKITIDRPIADTSPSKGNWNQILIIEHGGRKYYQEKLYEPNGKFESANTWRSAPMEIVPRRPDRSPE